MREHGDAGQAEAFYLEALARDPLDAEASEALQALWERSGDFHKLGEFLDQQAQTLPQCGASAQQVALLHFRLGALWSTHFGEPSVGLEQYKSAIELDPTLLRAMYEARQLCLAQNDARGASEMLEREAAAEPDTERKVTLLYELCALQRDALRDVDAALSALQRACALAPSDLGLCYELASLLILRAGTADAHTARGDLAQAADMLVRLAAQVDREQAVTYLESALDCAPAHEAAMSSLERLVEGTAETTRLPARWVEFVAAAPLDHAAHIRRVKLARAYASQGQLEDAIFCLRPAVDADMPAAKTLLQTLQKKGPSALQPQLGAELGKTDPSAMVSTAKRRGLPKTPSEAPAREELLAADTQEASALPVNTERVVLSEVTYVELDTPEDVSEEALSPATPVPAAASPVAEPIEDEQIEDEPPVIEPTDDPKALRRTALELARAQRHDEAAITYQRLLELDPLDNEAFAFLDGHHRRRQEHALRAALLERGAAPVTLSARTRESRLREAASTYEARLKDIESAIRCWNALEMLLPGSDEVRRAQKRLLERAERWDELARLYEAELAATADAEPKLPILRKLATLHRERRNDRASAIDALERLLVLRPDDRTTRDLLLEDLLAIDRHDDAIALLEHKLAETSAKRQKLELLQQIAMLCRDKLSDLDRAYAAYERILELAPADLEVLAVMVQLDEGGANPQRLLATLERLATHTKGAETAAIFARMAEIADSALSDKDRASALLSKAVDLAPDDPQYLRALCELYERHGQIEALLALLRERAKNERDAKKRAALLRRTAQLLIDYVQDEDGAADAYRALLALEEDVDALRFLQALAIKRDEPETLADVLKRLAAIEEDPTERNALLLQYARLLVGSLKRPAEAIGVLQRILASDPNHEEATEALLRACEAARDFPTLAKTLAHLLEKAEDAPTSAKLAARLADVCEHELRDPPRAIAALQAFCEADPGNVAPHRRLRRLLETTGRSRELCITLDALAHLESERSARIEATLAAAELARTKLQEPEAAWDRLLPWLTEADPAVDQALHALATQLQRIDSLYDLLEGAGRHTTLVGWLNQRVQRETNPKQRALLHRRVARTLEGPLDDEDGAATAWDKLLEIEEDAEALQFRRMRALRRDDMETVGDALKRLSKVEDDAVEKRDLLFEYGRLLRARLGRPAEAVAVLRTLLDELDPDFEPALDELIEACAASGDQRALAETLDRVLVRERDPERRVELARRLAELYEHTLKDKDRAIAVLHAWSQAAVRDAEPRRRLIALLTGTDRIQELLAQLDALADRVESESERNQIILQAAELAFSRLGDPEGAWQRLLGLANQGDEAAEALLSRVAFQSGKTEELAAVYETAGRHDDLVAILREQAEQTTDEDARADLYLHCAQVLAGPLGDELAAAEAFREVLQRRDDLQALTFLREHTKRADQPEELAQILLRLSRHTQDRMAQRDLLFERALLLAGRLHEADQASDALRSIVDNLDPTFRPAIDELITLSEARDDHACLALALERQLALEQSGAERAEIAERLAGLYEDKLADPIKAIAALFHLRDARPNSPQPLQRLRMHLENAERFEELLGVLDALCVCEDSAGGRVEATLAAAKIAGTKLSDAQGAWQRLYPLFLAGDAEAEAATVELANAASLSRDLVNLYVLRARESQSPAAALQDWTQAAQIYETQLHEPTEALEANLRALAIEMNNRTLLDAIDRLAKITSAWPRLTQVYGRLVQQAKNTETCIELLLRHAALLEQDAHDAGAALDRVMQVCKLAPQRVDLWQRAETLATATNNHAALIFVHESLATDAAEDEQKARHFLRIARSADLGLKDREQAMRAVAQALALAQSAPGISKEIETLARELDQARPELGKSDARRRLILAHMELAESAGATLGPQLILNAARLWRDELAADSECFDALKQGANLFPDHLVLYDALEKAAMRIKRLDALDAHLARVAPRASDPQVKRALLQRRAKLLGEHLDRHTKAAEVYRELLALDPDDETTFDALVDSYRQGGRYRELLKAYEDEAARTSQLPRKLGLMRAIAKLWEVELKNRPSALEVWQKIQTLDPDDEDAKSAIARLQK